MSALQKLDVQSHLKPSSYIRVPRRRSVPVPGLMRCFLTLAATMLRPMPLCFFNVTVTISGSFLIGCEESKEQTVGLELTGQEQDCELFWVSGAVSWLVLDERRRRRRRQGEAQSGG